MAIEELQHQPLGLRPPLQMTGRTDVQLGRATSNGAAAPQIEDSQKMRIPPAPQQQHGSLQPWKWRGVNRPRLWTEGVLLEPAAGHPFGIVTLQQDSALPQVAAFLKAASECQPGRLIALPACLKGGQLQAPTQPEMPPVGATLAAPVPSFIQAGHGRGQAVRRRRIDRCQKLGQALIGEAIAAKTSIALGSCADPGMGLCSVGFSSSIFFSLISCSEAFALKSMTHAHTRSVRATVAGK